jgi:hypothetical protein
LTLLRIDLPKTQQPIQPTPGRPGKFILSVSGPVRLTCTLNLKRLKAAKDKKIKKGG